MGRWHHLTRTLNPLALVGGLISLIAYFLVEFSVADLIRPDIGFLGSAIAMIIAAGLCVVAWFVASRLRVERISAIAVGALVILIGVHVFIDVPAQMRLLRGRQPCGVHLREITQAVRMYADDYDGHFPDRLEQLVVGGLLRPESLVCPISMDTSARGATLAELEAAYREPNHVSYTFLGAGRRQSDFAPDDVLVYETMSIHTNGTGSIAYADGSIHIVSSMHADIARTLSRLNSGSQPATAPAVKSPVGGEAVEDGRKLDAAPTTP